MGKLFTIGVVCLLFLLPSEAARWPWSRGSEDSGDTDVDANNNREENPDMASRTISSIAGISAESAQKLRRMISLPEIYNHVYNRVSEEITDFKSATPSRVRSVIRSAVTEKLDEQLHRDKCPVKLPWYSSLGRDSCHIIAQRIGNQVADSLSSNLNQAMDLMNRGFTVYQTLAQTTADYGRKAAQRIRETGETVKEKTGESYEYVKQKGSETAEGIRDVGRQAGERVASAGQAVKETAQSGAQYTKEKAQQAGSTLAGGMEYTKEKAKQAGQSVAETGSRIRQKTGQATSAAGEALSETGENIRSTGYRAADHIRNIVYGESEEPSTFGERYGIAAVQRYIITFVEAVLPRVMYEQLTSALKVPEEDTDYSLMVGPFDWLGVDVPHEPENTVNYGRPSEPDGLQLAMANFKEQFNSTANRLWGLQVFTVLLVGLLWLVVPILGYAYWTARRKLGLYESEFALKPREEQERIFERLEMNTQRDSI